MALLSGKLGSVKSKKSDGHDTAPAIGPTLVHPQMMNAELGQATPEHARAPATRLRPRGDSL